MRLVPVLSRNILEPIWMLLKNNPKRKYWKKLEKTQFLSGPTLKKKQWNKFKKMIEFVYGNNEFYQKRFDKAGIKPEDIKSPEDIKKIPILTKEEVRENVNLMISKGFKKEKLIEAKTGGSTGKSLILYKTEKCSELKNACARRHDRWSGWEVGEPIGAAWGNPHYPKTIKEKLNNFLFSPTIYLDTLDTSEKRMRKFIKDWKKVKPTLLFGNAHSLYILAKFVLDKNIISIKPKGVITTCMVLPTYERKIIEKAFGTKVTDRYGCEEVSLIGCECEKHKGMHINIEHLFVEFIKEDGEYAKPGEEGDIIVTDLLNKAMPFIRYKVQDKGIVSNKKCSCGRGLPLMEKVVGRVAESLIKKNGTRVAGVSLIENTLTKISGIEQMQITQNKIDEIVLNIVPDNQFSKERQEELILYFKKIFGKSTNIKLKKVKEIKQEKNGKYLFSICRVIK